MEDPEQLQEFLYCFIDTSLKQSLQEVIVACMKQKLSKVKMALLLFKNIHEKCLVGLCETGDPGSATCWLHHKGLQGIIRS